MDTGNKYERLFSHIDYLLDSSIEDLQKIIDENSEMNKSNDAHVVSDEHVVSNESISDGTNVSNESVINKIKRCNVEKCNKKIKSIEYITNKCKCQLLFCNKHKMPEQHDCKFNYIEHGKNSIKIKNPIVVNSKIDKI